MKLAAIGILHKKPVLINLIFTSETYKTRSNNLVVASKSSSSNNISLFGNHLFVTF